MPPPLSRVHDRAHLKGHAHKHISRHTYCIDNFACMLASRFNKRRHASGHVACKGEDNFDSPQDGMLGMPDMPWWARPPLPQGYTVKKQTVIQ